MYAVCAGCTQTAMSMDVLSGPKKCILGNCSCIFDTSAVHGSHSCSRRILSTCVHAGNVARGHDYKDVGVRAKHDYRDIEGRVTPGAVTEEARAEEARAEEVRSDDVHGWTVRILVPDES